MTMKTIKNLLAVTALLIGLTANAAENFDLSISENRTVTVSYENVASASKLRLMDANGVTLFNENVEPARSYKRTFNLEQLPQGEYIVALENDNFISYATFVKTPKEIKLISGGNNTVVFKPSYKQNENTVMLSVTNPTTTNASIKVYDKNGLLVASKNSKDLIVKEAFDFANAPRGTYTITIAVNNEIFTHKVEI
ncbi:MAG: hypothetical protein CL868_04390 [Cytophagaceae bacterium]|nr:hypothetical protein [Cytophagaceae bacterium]